eukprot:s688_g14.t1
MTPLRRSRCWPGFLAALLLVGCAFVGPAPQRAAREAPAARVSRRAEETTSSEDAPAAAAEWRPLLLARRSDVRQEALKELSGIFDEVSVEIFDEIERYGRDSKGVPALRLRPFLGYRAACASLYRTVTNHILPQQAGSPVELQKRTRDGEQRLRYVLKNDVLDVNGQEDLADFSDVLLS